MEWVFGVPELIQKAPNIKNLTQGLKYPVDIIAYINDDALRFTSPILEESNQNLTLLNQIYSFKNRAEVQCITSLNELLSLMKKEPEVAQYIYKMPPVTYQFARYTDWFKPYLND